MPLETFLERVARRLRLRYLLRGAAAGALFAAVVVLLLRAAAVAPANLGPAAIGAFAIAEIAGYLWSRSRCTPRRAATEIERRDTSLRNLLITAEQLVTSAGATRAYMRERVPAEAGRRAAAIDIGRSIPVGRDAAAIAGATLLLAVAATVPLPARAVGTRISRLPDFQISKSRGFVLEIAPPQYSGRPAVTLQNPSSVEVLAGSRGTLRVTGDASVQLRVNDAATALAGGRAEIEFTQSGYLALEGGGLDRLVPLTVTQDRAPEVRITAPAKDLRVSTVAAAIPIAAEAADDLGLRSLELRYTLVSGTGEQFTFTEGSLPATVSRASDRAWRLEARLSLAALKLEPGDALIYRAVAADRRPGDAGIASSDTFFVEIAGPGDVPLEGVEMPPDKERYALSEAMIVLKIERLQEREKTLAREALVEAAGNIAAEQRAVRANFIFLLGGEVEDEEAEAQSSNEISEGRFANQARREIVGATVLMGRVEKALAVPSTPEALALAREAVKALQRAFGHSRYLLRALPSRARIDPSRRLSGDVSTALDWTRALAPPAPDPQVETARAALTEIAAANGIVNDPATRAATAARLGRLAERLLAAGSTQEWQSAARAIIAARDALLAGQSPAAATALRRAADPLLKIAQRGRIDGTTIERGAARLAGAAAVAPAGRGGQ